jgi:hypothetical protein
VGHRSKDTLKERFSENSQVKINMAGGSPDAAPIIVMTRETMILLLTEEPIHPKVEGSGSCSAVGVDRFEELAAWNLLTKGASGRWPEPESCPAITSG